eukprot:m.53535 g.53535  ORF g.53535 m.53535 type:complete len:1070 (+) comp7464_c0_seq1:477-3686(+)
MPRSGLSSEHAAEVRAATIDHPKLRRSKLVFALNDELSARTAKRRSAPSNYQRESPRAARSAAAAANVVAAQVDPLMPHQKHPKGTKHTTTPMAELQTGHAKEAVTEMRQLLEEDIEKHHQHVDAITREDSSIQLMEEHLRFGHQTGRPTNEIATEVIEEFRIHGRPTVFLHELETAPEESIHVNLKKHDRDVGKLDRGHSHHHSHHYRWHHKHKRTTTAEPRIHIDPWIATLVRQQNIRDHGMYHHVAQVASSYPFQIVCIVIVWLIIGSCFYHYDSGFGVAQAFFFTIQAGLSVGYGADGVTCYDADDVDACQYFTAFQVLLTSWLISSLLSAYLDALICNSFNEWEEIKREVLNRYGANNDTFVHQQRGEREDADRARSPLRAMRSMDEASYPDEIDLDGDEDGKPEHMIAQIKKMVQRPLKSLRKAARVPYIRMATWVLLWVILGIVWAYEFADMTGPEALLFSITSLSTGGLTQPNAKNDATSWFIGIFCLFGIPMYAGLLGSIAGYLTTRRNRSLLRDRLHSSISNTDIMCMSALHGHHDDHFDYADYLSLQLIKLGAVSPATIGKIQAHFIEMDDNDSGTLSRDQLLVEHAFDSVDTSKLGVIDRKEFAQLCTYLAKCGNSCFERIVSSKGLFEAQFSFLAESSRQRQQKSEQAMTSHERDIRIRASDDFITRQVFCQWWVAVKRKAHMEADVLEAVTSLEADTMRSDTTSAMPVSQTRKPISRSTRIETLDLAGLPAESTTGASSHLDVKGKEDGVAKARSCPPQLRGSNVPRRILGDATIAESTTDEMETETEAGMAGEGVAAAAATLDDGGVGPIGDAIASGEVRPVSTTQESARPPQRVTVTTTEVTEEDDIVIDEEYDSDLSDDDNETTPPVVEPLDDEAHQASAEARTVNLWSALRDSLATLIERSGDPQEAAKARAAMPDLDMTKLNPRRSPGFQGAGGMRRASFTFGKPATANKPQHRRSSFSFGSPRRASRKNNTPTSPTGHGASGHALAEEEEEVAEGDVVQSVGSDKVGAQRQTSYHEAVREVDDDTLVTPNISDPTGTVWEPPTTSEHSL